MIKDNIERIRSEIFEAAVRAGRRPEEVTLCAVTKKVDAQKAR